MEKFVLFRNNVEALKDLALEQGYNEAEAYYLLVVAAEELKDMHLAEMDDDLDVENSALLKDSEDKKDLEDQNHFEEEKSTKSVIKTDY